MMVGGTGGRSVGSSAWSSHRGYSGWDSDLEVHLGGNFGLESPGSLSYPVNSELLLSSPYAEYSKHKPFLMHHSLWKFIQSWGYVQKLSLLRLMLSYFGWERLGVWIAALFIFLSFLSNCTHAENDNTTHCLPAIFHCWTLAVVLWDLQTNLRSWPGYHTVVSQSVVCVPLLVHQPLFTGTQY